MLRIPVCRQAPSLSEQYSTTVDFMSYSGDPASDQVQVLSTKTICTDPFSSVTGDTGDGFSLINVTGPSCSGQHHIGCTSVTVSTSGAYTNDVISCAVNIGNFGSLANAGTSSSVKADVCCSGSNRFVFTSWVDDQRVTTGYEPNQDFL